MAPSDERTYIMVRRGGACGAAGAACAQPHRRVPEQQA
jgi:hypothetical protein